MYKVLASYLKYDCCYSRFMTGWQLAWRWCFLRKLVGILNAPALKVARDSMSNDALNFAVSVLKVNRWLVFPSVLRRSPRYVLTGAVLSRRCFFSMACSGAHKDQFVELRCWGFADHEENVAEEVAPHHNREEQ